MEDNKIKKDYQIIFKLLEKFCKPSEPKPSAKGGRTNYYSNLFILTLGCLWLKNGKPAQEKFLQNVRSELKIRIPRLFF